MLSILIFGLLRSTYSYYIYSYRFISWQHNLLQQRIKRGER